MAESNKSFCLSGFQFLLVFFIKSNIIGEQKILKHALPPTELDLERELKSYSTLFPPWFIPGLIGGLTDSAYKQYSGEWCSCREPTYWSSTFWKTALYGTKSQWLLVHIYAYLLSLSRMFQDGLSPAHLDFTHSLFNFCSLSIKNCSKCLHQYINHCDSCPKNNCCLPSHNRAWVWFWPASHNLQVWVPQCGLPMVHGECYAK